MSTTESAGEAPPLDLPCALIRLLPFPAAAFPSPSPSTLLAQAFQGVPGVRVVGTDLLAVLPLPGDPDVFDVAVAGARRVVAAASEPGAGLIVLPGSVRLRGEKVELAPDPLAESAGTAPPEVAGAGTYLSGRAAVTLEHDWELLPQRVWQSPAGAAIPLLRAGRPRLGFPHWRNHELPARRRAWLPRAGTAEELRRLAPAPVLLVTGPPGSGKTRLVAHWLEATRPVVWATAHPLRTRGASLAEQLLRGLQSVAGAKGDLGIPRRELNILLASLRLGSGSPRDAAALVARACARLPRPPGQPFRLVCDGLEAAGPTDLGFLAALVGSRQLASAFRLVLVARSGRFPPSDWPPLPQVEVPFLSRAETRALAGRLCSGLEIPDRVFEGLVRGAGGSPFVLEEGLVDLTQSKRLRQVYGHYFFSGGDEPPGPSDRLVRHLTSEALRSGDLRVSQILALADRPVPPGELRAAAALAGSAPLPHWERRLLDAGLVRAAVGPWGEGIEFSCPLWGGALRRTVPEPVARRLRWPLGELLAARSSGSEGHWQAYLLLAGSPAAPEVLLAAVREGAPVPREAVLEALAGELWEHRRRGGAPALELELLWELLPLARRSGRLADFDLELSRAVELAGGDSRRHLALASLKAGRDEDAGRPQDAEATLRGALAAREAEPRRRALVLLQLARLLLRQDRLREARDLLLQLEKALDREGTAALVASCRFYLGNIAFRERRLGEALQLHRGALEERRRQGLARAIGASLSALGAIHLTMGDYPGALLAYREAQEVLGSAGGEDELAFVLLGLGRTLGRLGDTAAAAPPLRRAVAIRESRGDLAGVGVARLAAAENQLDLGHAEDALEEARRAHFQLSLGGSAAALADAEQLLGRTLLKRRALGDAERHLTAALTAHDAAAHLEAAAKDESWLVETALAREDAEAVRHHVNRLIDRLRLLPDTDRSETLDFRAFRALSWLAERGRQGDGDPDDHLARAYRELLRKASHLAPDVRHRFLAFEAEHQAILDAATRRGLAAPVAPD